MFLDRNITVTQKGNRRNIILLLVESFELQNVGKWSLECPNNMQFLRNLSSRGFFTDNYIAHEYVKFTAAAVYTINTNLPLIYRHIKESWKGIHPPNLQQILEADGYQMYQYFGGNCQIAAIGELAKSMGYRTTCHRTDFSHMQVISRTILPKLKTAEVPVFITIYIEGSHFLDLFLFDGCQKRVPKCSDFHQSYDCIDQVIQKYWTFFQRNNLSENTDFIVMGDHLHMVHLKHIKDRKLGVWIPTRQLKTNQSQPRGSSAFDIFPTILDLLDIKIYPPPPFGASLLSDEPEYNLPSAEDYVFITQFFKNKFNQKKHCFDIFD